MSGALGVREAQADTLPAVDGRWHDTTDGTSRPMCNWRGEV